MVAARPAGSGRPDPNQRRVQVAGGRGPVGGGPHGHSRPTHAQFPAARCPGWRVVAWRPSRSRSGGTTPNTLHHARGLARRSGLGNLA